MKLKPAHTLYDTRWLHGIEQFRGNPDPAVQAAPAAKNFDPFALLEDTVTCTACRCALEETDRDEVLQHYKSDWHRKNVLRVSHGKPPLSEEQFDDEFAEEDASSESSDSDEEEVFMDRLLGSTYEYFVQDGEVFSVYKCIVPPGEELDISLFRKTIDCAIFMLAGGHFAGAVYKRGQMIHHKTIHRYTVRAKQGGSQKAQDARGGTAHSAGSALRRYNERTLCQEIQKLIKEWSSTLSETPLIFIRCSSFHRDAFFGENLFSSKDSRMRTLPFQTIRPGLDEIKRVYALLASIFAHGPEEEFILKLKNSREKTRQVLTKKRKEQGIVAIADSDEEEKASQEAAKLRQEKTERKKIGTIAEKEEREALDPFADIDKLWRASLYTGVRNDDAEQLQKLIENPPCDAARSFQFLSEFRAPPDGSSFLHLAAKNSYREALQTFLDAGVFPSMKNEKGEVPFDVSADKSVRNLFMAFRNKQAEVNDKLDWRSTHIPMPTAKAEKDEAQLEIEREKKRVKKERQRERQKVKKAEEKVEAAEKAAQAEWLSLSDRERRARAAEARMAKLEPKQGPRCYQCGGVMPAKPFNYSNFEFCAPACVALHRNSQPAAKNI